MSNTLLNISMITREALMELKGQLSFAGAVNRQYDSQFAKEGGKIGATANIRKPVRFAVTDGAALNLQNVADQYVALTIDTQQHVGFEFSSKDLALSIEEFRARYLKPAITALANQIDYKGLLQYVNIPGSVGTPGTAPTTVQCALDAGAVLSNQGAPVDGQRSLVLDPSTEASVVGGSLTLFNPARAVSDQYSRGKMGEAAGFTWMMDQSVASHTSGAVDGTPAVKTTIVADGSTIAIDGITTASITADANASGNEIASLSLSPSMVLTGPYQNISAYPVDGGLVKLFGAASTYASKVSPANLAFHRDAFALAMIDLPLPGGVDMAARASDPDAGLSIRIVRQYDINNDVMPCRLDVLYGWKTLYPELACRIQG